MLGKKEDPKAVSDEIALRNEQAIAIMGTTSVVIPYSNVNELTAAYRRKEVSLRMFEAYLRILNKKTAKAPAPAGKKSSLGE